MYRLPQTNVDYWANKIEHNRQRDHATLLRLKAMGWHTVEIWECQLKPKEREITLNGLLRTLNFISLQNQGARFLYTLQEEESSMAAEDDRDD